MRILKLTFFLLISAFSFAQSGSVLGTVADKETNEPVSFCNVVLMNSMDSIINGTISDIEGKFQINGINNGNYYLSIQSITHKEFKTESFSISPSSTKKDFGRLNLESTSIQTEEVTIEVERAAVKIEPAKKTFDVKATGADAGGTAVDVLNNLPSVEVDENGTISLRGNSNIRVLIDGKPAGFNADDITTVINQLPANSIETIEVITVPSAKYDPEGIGGIINIVMKKEKKKGYRGNANVSYSTVDKINSRFSISLNKKKWSINTSYSYADGTYWNRRTSDGFFALPDSFVVFNNYKDGLRRRPNHNGNLNIGYKVNKVTNVSLEGAIRQTSFITTDSTEFFWNYNDVAYDANSRAAKRDGNRTSGTGQFNLNSNFKNGNKITFLSRAEAVQNPRNGYFTEPFVTQKETRNFEAETFVNQLDFTFPIKKAKDDTINGSFFTLETGAKTANRAFKEEFSFFEFNPSLATYEEQLEFTNNLDYGEGVYAGYGLMNFGNKGIQYSLGLRGEYSQIKSQTKEGNFNKNLLNFFPSASIVKNFSETRSLTVSYSKRIKRPRGNQLNPIPSYSDPFTLRIGNADLVPEKSHMSEISYLNIGKKAVFNSTVFHQFRDDRLGRLSYTDSLGVSTIQWINFNFHQTLGLELYYNYKFSKWFKANGSFTLYNTWVDGENFREGFTAVYLGHDSKLNLQFKVSKNTNITWTGDFNSRRLAVVGVVFPRGGSDISLKHKVLKNKGALTLRYTDIFRTRMFRIEVDTDGWLREVRYRWESQLLWVGFNYNFGQSGYKGKKKFKRVSPNDRSF